MKRTTRKILRDYSMTVGVAIVLALGIRILLIEAYRIPGSAMRPTLESGDTIFVAKWTFGLRVPFFSAPVTKGRPPAYGDVIVFSSPIPGVGDYIKRVIGLPGDTVSVKNGQVMINEKILTSDFKGMGACGPETSGSGDRYEICIEPPILEEIPLQKVPSQSVFVLGDLRSTPLESRKLRPPHMISYSLIKGKAMWVWLSLDPNSNTPGLFPKFRFERMFRRIH